MKNFIYKIHSLSIRRKMVFSYTLIAAFAIIISFMFSYNIVSTIVLDKVKDANMVILDDASKSINRMLDNITYCLIYIANNAQLRNTLSINQNESFQNYSKDESTFKRYQENKDIDAVLSNSEYLNILYNPRITILSKSSTDYGNWEDFYKYTASFKDMQWYKDLIASKSKRIMWLGINHNGAENDKNFYYVLESVIPIKENDSSLNNLGIVHMQIPESVVYNLLELDNDMGNKVFLVDKDTKIMSSKNKDDITTYLSRQIASIDKINKNTEGSFIDKDSYGRKNVVYYVTIDRTDWKLVSIIDYNKMLEPLFDVRDVLLITHFIFILVFILVALLISNTISKPIMELSRMMKKIEQGNFDNRMKVFYGDEVGILSKNFNDMLDKVCDLLELTKRQEKLKREAEFEALQAQINPHFLFNTLSSIRWAAAAYGDKKVEDMVLALSVLLKGSISSGPELITLREEVHILENYIKLYQMKYGFPIKFDCDIDEEVLNIRIPRLLIQPIIENSIIHAFEEIPKDAVIKISDYIDNDILKIEIADNGKGIDEKILDDILNGKLLKDDKRRYNSSIGLKNINDRIKLNFGERYGLEIRNGDNNIGTVVTLVLPFRKESNDA